MKPPILHKTTRILLVFYGQTCVFNCRYISRLQTHPDNPPPCRGGPALQLHQQHHQEMINGRGRVLIGREINSLGIKRLNGPLPFFWGGYNLWVYFLGISKQRYIYGLIIGIIGICSSEIPFFGDNLWVKRLYIIPKYYIREHHLEYHW